MVISRVPAPDDGSAPKTSSAVAILLVLVVVLGIWLINGRDPGTGTSGGGASEIPVFTEGPTTDVAEPGAPDEVEETEEAQQPESGGADPDSGLPLVDLADLPVEASDTVELIDRGPPYPYDQDGSTFQNREGLLPDADLGYYEEFTVEMPGSDDRGPLRIVVGDDGELYWTEDHYDSFERIRR